MVVALGPTGAVNLYNSLGAVDVVADVEGYFTAPSGTQGQFHPIAPLRVCDTRLGQPANPCNDGRGPRTWRWARARWPRSTWPR